MLEGVYYISKGLEGIRIVSYMIATCNSKPLLLFKEGFLSLKWIAFFMEHFKELLSVVRTFVLLTSTE